MLILERRQGEWIRAGDEISVLVHKIGSDRVWLGFDAPRSIAITRDDCRVSSRGTRELLALDETMANSLKQTLIFHGTPADELGTADDLYQKILTCITGGV